MGCVGLPLATAAVSSLTWTSATGAGSYVYTDVATSDDGQKILAVSSNANEIVRYSADGGSTWSTITPSRTGGSASHFYSVSISGDGSTAYLAVGSGGPASGSKVYKTTNFSTWSQLSTGDTTNYGTVSTNLDGTKVIIGGPSSTSIKISTDGGATWPTSTSYVAYGCEMSSDGVKILCFGDTQTLKISTDGGSTWNSRAIIGTRFLFEGSAAISGDGTVMYAIWSDYGGATEGKSKVYKSTNDGVNWTEITANLPETASNANTGFRNYCVIATNSSGSVVIVGSFGRSTLTPYYQSGYLYLSDDSGSTWTKQLNSGSSPWATVAVNGSGSKLVAAAGQSGYAVTGPVKTATLNVITSSNINSLALAGGTLLAGYRTPIQITANVSAAGRVTFLANGKRIAGCIKKETSGSSPNITATCSFNPTVRGSVRLTAELAPTDPYVLSSKSSQLWVVVSNRNSYR